MNIIQPKQLFKTIYRFVGIVGISSAICLPSFARPYYYPHSSFFSPTAYYYQSEDDPNLMEMLDVLGYQTLSRNLKEAALTKKLSQEKPVTIFAPTDEAFEALSPEIKEKLAQPEILEKVLKYHVFLGLVSEENIKGGEIVSLDGETIKISGESIDGEVVPVLNEAKASEPYVARNGLIIPIDSVLIPPSLLDQ